LLEQADNVSSPPAMSIEKLSLEENIDVCLSVATRVLFGE
jgi:hypothetical protein